jgi:hypothetical protein
VLGRGPFTLGPMELQAGQLWQALCELFWLYAQLNGAACSRVLAQGRDGFKAVLWKQSMTPIGFARGWGSVDESTN